MHANEMEESNQKFNNSILSIFDIDLETVRFSFRLYGLPVTIRIVHYSMATKTTESI